MDSSAVPLPRRIEPEVIQLIRERDNLVPYFDMPIQHIQDRMLKLMNRRLTKEQIKTAIRSIREAIPEAVLRTQFIVGFPGEQESDFQEILDFMDEVEFDNVGCFSPEEEPRAPRSPIPCPKM